MSGGNNAEILRSFIADEDQALAADRQGRFWPSNHHMIRPLAARPGVDLTPDERTRFYAHFIRVSGEIPAVPDKEMPPLIDAYRSLLPRIDGRGAAFLARRHVLLFAFGFDETGPLPSGTTTMAKDLKARLKTVTQIGKYTSLPAQRDKKASFLPFNDEAPRLLETLRHLAYRHDRRYADDLYDVLNLAFWGMVLIVLQHRSTRTELLRDMLDRYELPQTERQLAILDQTVVTVRPDVSAAETEFLGFAERLASIRRERRDATESVALAKALALPFDDEEDWTIQITIPQQGSDLPALLAPGIVLSLRPDPDDPWQLRIRHPERGTFAEWNGKITQNDPGIEGLGRGNLARFPDWLRATCERHGIAFDCNAADIRAGRKRAAAKAIAAWISDR